MGRRAVVRAGDRALKGVFSTRVHPWLAGQRPPVVGRAPVLSRDLTPEVFEAAWARVRRHPSPGVDGITAGRFAADLPRTLERLRSTMLDRSYRPGRLLHVAVPKSDGGERVLGIPTLADRVAQVAVHLVVMPYLDRGFHEHVHGYRPGRSPETAVRQLRSRVGRKRWIEVLKVDVEGLFDHLDHGVLRRSAQRAVVDPLWWDLMDTWMRAWPTGVGRGVPQGAPLSPLFANLYLHDHLDRHMGDRGLGGATVARGAGYVAGIRFGDDLVAVSDLQGGALRLLGWIDGLCRGCGLRLSDRKCTFDAGSPGGSFGRAVLGYRLVFLRDGDGLRIDFPEVGA